MRHPLVGSAHLIGLPVGERGRDFQRQISHFTLPERNSLQMHRFRRITFSAHPAGASVSGPVDRELVELRRVDTHLIDDRSVPATDVVSLRGAHAR